jgi:heat shock protein HslJ
MPIMMMLRHAVLALALVSLASATARAQGAREFPFGAEMTLEAAAQPGSKRIPTLEIGDNGEAQLDLWCKSGRGQFSVANDSVIFVPGAMAERGCTPAQAQADDALLAALAAAERWTRQGDFVSFVGATTLRFRLSTN